MHCHHRSTYVGRAAATWCCHGAQQGRNFNSLLQDSLPVIDPAFVVCTGDITDANKGLTPDRRGQNEEEWESYRTALRGAGVDGPGGLPWLDVRGNHDAFNVPTYAADQNLFRLNAVSERRGSEMGLVRPSPTSDGANSPHYVFDYEAPFGSYRFVAVDAAVEPAASRHFFGRLTTGALDHLEAAVLGDVKASGTVVFGHYPVTSIVDDGARSSTGRDVFTIFEEGGVVAHLSGHLHGLLGSIHPWLGETLHGRLPKGTLELEVADMAHRGRYRIFAFDHDVLSAVDATVGEWPVGLVTNPPESRLLSQHEPFEIVRDSTHIRVLAFSPFGIAGVSAEIDGGGEQHGRLADSVPHQQTPTEAGALWVVPWEPAKLSPGTHKLRVVVSDMEGNERVLEQDFSVDGTAGPQPSAFAQAVVGGNMRHATVIAVAISLGTVVAVLVSVEVMRLVLKQQSGCEDDGALEKWLQRAAATCIVAENRGHEGEDGTLKRRSFFSPSLMWLPTFCRGRAELMVSLKRIAVLTVFPYVHLRVTRPKTFYFLLGFALYLPLGPWFVGRVYNDQWTVVFAWALVGADFVVPHFDATINMALLCLFSYVPLVHLLAVSSAARDYPSHFSRAVSVPGAVLSIMIWKYAQKGVRSELSASRAALQLTISAPPNLWLLCSVDDVLRR